MKEQDKISGRGGSRQREKKVKGKTRMFFCLFHLLQVTPPPQSVACLQSGSCSEHTSGCVQSCQPWLSMATGTEDALGSSWPIPPSLSCAIHSLYSAPQLLTYSLERGLLLQVTDSGHSSQRRKVLLGCQDHSGTKCTLGYGDNWV